eukprot:scaffold51859_cov52-Attheya_sp.AAC.3
MRRLVFEWILLSWCLITGAKGWSCTNRREVLSIITSATTAAIIVPQRASGIDDIGEVAGSSVTSRVITNTGDYENRARRGNKEALIREDVWYMLGKQPPRQLPEGALSAESGPEYNAWGTCITTGGQNSCTYVPLKQRYPAYSKYAFNIQLGAQEYSLLGKAIEAQDWDRAQSYLVRNNNNSPPPVEDALLKMVLMGTQFLTTPNYSGPPRELLVARFYVNEAHYATVQLRNAVACHDAVQSQQLWNFGRDSWNSYLALLNRGITEKVGDKIPLI